MMLRTISQQQNAITVDFSGQIANIASLTANNNRKSRRGFDKALQTVAVLQTTLEVEQLIRLFSREVGMSVSHSSVTYLNEPQDIDYTAGRIAKHACTYRIVIEKRELGQITYTRGKPFTQSECALLEYLLCSLVYPLRNALQYKDAFQASLTDPLTGVYNRTVMENALRRESGLSQRHNTPLSLIVLDIDEFKSVNDVYGHKMGDNLIKTVTQSVSHCLRETDLLSRYGGDEFTILLGNTNQAGAKVLANHISSKIEESECMLGGCSIKVTVSMGIASLTKKDKNKDLFARADAALYRAKREGRNRIRVADSA